MCQTELFVWHNSNSIYFSFNLSLSLVYAKNFVNIILKNMNILFCSINQNKNAYSSHFLLSYSLLLVYNSIIYFYFLEGCL